MDNTLVSTGSVQQRVYQLVGEETDTAVERLDRETRFAEITDSLGQVEALMLVEDEFEISIADAEAENLKTVGGMIDLVEAKLRERRQPQPAAAPAPTTDAATAPPGQ